MYLSWQALRADVGIFLVEGDCRATLSARRGHCAQRSPSLW